MRPPFPQRYKFEGRRLGIAPEVVDRALAAMQRIAAVDPRMAVVLTLRHLSELSDVPYGYLRRVAARRAGACRSVRLRKRVPGRSQHRLISIPPPQLMKVQRWIVANILSFAPPSAASFAYHPGSQPLFAAQVHCGCRWLLKIDIEDFFHAISESQVARVFAGLGYQRLLAFEMARLTTVVLADASPRPAAQSGRWRKIPAYSYTSEGVLPQGGPTSPMLSNLVLRVLDGELSDLAALHGVRYTRYADDMAFSCVSDATRDRIKRFERLVLARLSAAGFRPNRRKTVLRGPGSRKVVLGMLVDGPAPRLPREYKDMLRLHLHYLTSPDHGPSAHARRHRTSVSKMFHRVRG